MMGFCGNQFSWRAQKSGNLLEEKVSEELDFPPSVQSIREKFAACQPVGCGVGQGEILDADNTFPYLKGPPCWYSFLYVSVPFMVPNKTDRFQ